MSRQFLLSRRTLLATAGAALTALAATPVAAQAPAGGPATAGHGKLTISDAWARATPPGARTGVVYFTIANDGGEADRLINGTTPAAAKAEIHTHIMEGGVARMQGIAAVEISPGEPAVFQPGGLHLMLIDLRAPLRDGETFRLTLTFARAGTVSLDVPVRRTAPATNRQPPAPSHQH